MTITISANDPRTIKALAIAADAGQWLKCRTADGVKAYGIPSQRTPGHYYLVDCQTCTCVDFKRHGLSGARVGQTGEHRVCKHILAVRLWVDLCRARQVQPQRRRGRLSVVR